MDTTTATIERELVEAQYEPGAKLLPSRGLPYQRTQLCNSRGERYVDYLKTLRPKYRQVRLDIAAGYASLAVICSLAVVVQKLAPSPWLALVVVPLFALAIAFNLIYIGGFMHEAVHGNLAPNRDQNDILVNTFVCCLFGQEIKGHRLVHFDHHRYLGTDRDPENTYRAPLDLEFLVKALTGIKLIGALLRRAKEDTKRRAEQSSEEASRTLAEKGHPRVMLISGLAINGSIVLLSLLTGAWWLTCAWTFGMLCLYPFIGTIRQVLEHRPNVVDAADGATSRMFGDDWLSRVYGSAGFTRHLLHHWEPQVSYTRLAELEAFLLDTEARKHIETRRLGYASTFKSLFSWR